MTTDITELAQRMKAAAVRAKAATEDYVAHRMSITVCLEECKEFNDLSDGPDNILALVEALEKAQRANAAQDDHINQQQDHIESLEKKNAELGKYAGELEAIRAAAEKLVRCKGRYHSEQNYRALAALFGVNTPDLPPLEHENVHYADAAEIEIAALRQRISELEESHAQVIQSRDHYKRMTEEGLKQLAESRSVTIEPFRSFVTDADLAALHRFAECCDDPESGGHDLEKEQVRRLEAIGALQRSGRISYITGFGDVLILNRWHQGGG